MKIQPFGRMRGLELFLASTVVAIVLATLPLCIAHSAKAAWDTNVSFTHFSAKQQLVTEWVALVDGGKQWGKIGDAGRRMESFERGGRNPKTKIEWSNYRIVKMPGNNYQVSIGLHKTKEELLEIIERWQRYDPDHHFQILTLEHHGEANVWKDANRQGFTYTQYFGNVAKSERK